MATGAHRLQLAIAHSGEIGADDIRSSLQHPLLFDEAALVEPRSPGQACVGVGRDMAVHPADLGTEAFDGTHQSFSEGRAPDQKTSVAAELKCDEMKVDGDLGGVARSL